MIEFIGEDPGGKTGLARFTVSDAWDVLDWEAFEVSADGAANWLGHWLPHYAREGRKVIVGCERFVITPATGRMGGGGRYDAIEMIGVTRHLCRWYGHEFVLRSAGDAKSVVSNGNLKQAGWWTPKTDGHALDATRHAIVQMIERGYVPSWL